MSASPRVASAALRGVGDWLPLGLVGALVAWAVFFGGGSGSSAVPWLGTAVAAVLAGLGVAAGLGRLDVPRPARPALLTAAALVALLAWMGLSVVWSIAPDRSWATFNRSLVALGFLALGLVAARGPRAARLAAAGLALVLGAALAWALAGRAIPAFFPDGERVARLRNSVGYWNGLALLADFALALGLWLATRPGWRVAWRAAGAVLVYAAVLVILLAASRTGIVTAIAVVALWLALADRRVEGALTLVAAATPAVALAGWAFTRPALVDDGQAYADRVGDGAAFGVLALLGGALVAGLVVAGVRRGLSRRRETGRALALAGAAACALGLVALVLAVGNPIAWAGDQFTSDTATSSGPDRLTELGSNNRWEWWQEAWQVVLDHPVAGAGAGTFEVARKRYRENGLTVTQPHQLQLQAAAGLGAVGLLLVVGAMAGVVATGTAAVRRLDGEERAAACALVCVPAAFLVHSLADYDWDFLAVTAPALAVVGVLGSAGRPAAYVRSRLVAAAAVLVAAAAVYSLASPALAERETERAAAALDRGDAAAALAHADSARSLDPFSLDPLLWRATALERLGRGDEAEAAYSDVLELQPENPDAWYEVGIARFVAGDDCRAYEALNRAYTLDPNSATRWLPGGPLDRTRAAVNAGACKPSG